MSPLLDWGDASHFEQARNRACHLCGKPTPMRSHAGEPAHKVCAELWNATHPDEARRYTVPTKARPVQRDVGTWRFHNDGPVTAKRLPNLSRIVAGDSPPTVDVDVEPGQRGLFAA
ncbi:hypothetical protein [Streptomyces sp. NPDC090135]|uniref:hypothetical protein n=1 Tax=Streptomyces sp. NPDC090135 TaxID=3365957 RepID=UPI003820A4E5